MAEEVKTEAIEAEKTAQPETQPTADKVDIDAIVRETAAKAADIGEKRSAGSFKSMLEQAGIDAERAAQETEKWIAATKQREMDIEKLKSENEQLSKEALKAEMLEKQLKAIAKGIPADKTEKYVKLTEAYPEAETFDEALDLTIAEFPIKSDTPKFIAPSSTNMTSDVNVTKFSPEVQKRLAKYK